MRGAAATAGRRPLRVPALSARLRRRLLALVVLVALLAAGYQFWLRDSSLVAVEDVKVSGLTTNDAERVRNALESAATSMTTLHVRPERLEQAVAAFPVVRDIEVSAEFPHGLRIRVIEHHPAALIEVGGREVPVAGDGTVLAGLPIEGRLPAIGAEGRIAGDRLEGAAALHAARVAGAVPGALVSRVETVTMRSGDGIVVELTEGPELLFGDGSRARAKWIAAVRVLADPEAEGAAYIDVRLPSRPAAGGLPGGTITPVAPADQTSLAPPSTAAAAAAAAGADPLTGEAPAAVTPVSPPAAQGTTPPVATTTPATGTPTPPAAGTPTPQAGQPVGGGGVAPPG